MSQILKIREKASKQIRRILLPEAEKDIRVINAAIQLKKLNLVEPVLLGDPEKIQELCTSAGIDFPYSIEIYSHRKKDYRDKKFIFFKEKMAHKNPTDEQIYQMCENELFTAGWLLKNRFAHGAVAGSVASTSEVILAALRTVGVSANSSLVSSSFLMEMPDGRVFTYADCAVVPYPTSDQLASIAIDSGLTHKRLTGEDPKIAFLSFSTKGSARHDSVTLVKEAFLKAKSLSDWKMDGELQFDTALIPAIAATKAPGSTLKGDASVFIFPNLDAGNIAYKITERLGGAVATGPVLQGLNRPFMDLSRGCSVDDIMNTACVCALLQ
jgi:phosphate acetyltransferase